MAGTAWRRPLRLHRPALRPRTTLQFPAGKSGVQANSSTSANATENATINKNGSQAAAASQLQSGTAVHATLDKPVDARKAKAGDQVLAKTTEDIKSDGKVVVPRGSKLCGPRNRGSGSRRRPGGVTVGFAFDHAVLKNGRQVPSRWDCRRLGSAAQTAQCGRMNRRCRPRVLLELYPEAAAAAVDWWAA